MHDYVFDVNRAATTAPNHTRNELILNGGNPDQRRRSQRSRTSYPVGTQPDPTTAYDAYRLRPELRAHRRDRIQERSTSAAARRAACSSRATAAATTSSCLAQPKGNRRGINGVNMDGFNDPDDIIEDPRNGNLYVAQLGTANSPGEKNVITLLKPDHAAVRHHEDQIVSADTGGSLGVLKSKSTHNLADKETRNWTIRALTDASTAKVVFELDGVHPPGRTSRRGSRPAKGAKRIAQRVEPVPGHCTRSDVNTPYKRQRHARHHVGAGLLGDRYAQGLRRQHQLPARRHALRQGLQAGLGPASTNLRGNGCTMGWNKSAQALMYDRNLQPTNASTPACKLRRASSGTWPSPTERTRSS
jgi:hypothetical protein